MLGILENFGTAFVSMWSLGVLVAIVSGVVFGIILGALPGFGAAQSLALLFPLTFAMPADQAIIFFLAIYSAAEYGGSIPAILIRTPGTPGSAITAIEGYAMAKKGLANKALRISLWSGVIGGIASTIIFILAGTSIAYIALQFGPGEMFALGIFGLSIIGSFFGKDPARGFLATGIGLILATIGSSDFGGMRFTFGQAYLMDGLPVVVVIIGLMAGPEAFRLLVEHRKTVEPKMSLVESGKQRELDRFTRADAVRLIPTWIRSTLIGTGIGALPGAGATVGSLVAYSEEKRWSKQRDLFGTGSEDGLAAPEAANNAVVAGTLVPSLTLGIPGSGAAAILIGVLISKGVVPGPLLFTNQPLLIAMIFMGLIFINLWMLVIGLFFSRAFALVAKVPRRILGPFVLLMILLGSYAYETYTPHVVMVVIISLAAYWFTKIEIPVVPIVLAFVMGPIVEENFSRALTIHAGDIGIVLTRPITLVIMALSLATLVYGVISYRRTGGMSETFDEEIA